MFYRSSRDRLICLGVGFALMCNRQMLLTLGRQSSLLCLLRSLQTHFTTHSLENQAPLKGGQQQYSRALECGGEQPCVPGGADKTQPLNLKEGFCALREQMYDSW